MGMSSAPSGPPRKDCPAFMHQTLPLVFQANEPYKPANRFENGFSDFGVEEAGDGKRALQDENPSFADA